MQPVGPGDHQHHSLPDAELGKEYPVGGESQFEVDVDAAHLGQQAQGDEVPREQKRYREPEDELRHFRAPQTQGAAHEQRPKPDAGVDQDRCPEDHRARQRPPRLHEVFLPDTQGLERDQPQREVRKVADKENEQHQPTGDP